jgi:hypothetical protein
MKMSTHSSNFNPEQIKDNTSCIPYLRVWLLIIQAKNIKNVIHMISFSAVCTELQISLVVIHIIITRSKQYIIVCVCRSKINDMDQQNPLDSPRYPTYNRSYQDGHHFCWKSGTYRGTSGLTSEATSMGKWEPNVSQSASCIYPIIHHFYCTREQLQELD